MQYNYLIQRNLQQELAEYNTLISDFFNITSRIYKSDYNYHKTTILGRQFRHDKYVQRSDIRDDHERKWYHAETCQIGWAWQ